MIKPELLQHCRCLARDLTVKEVSTSLSLSDKLKYELDEEWEAMLKDSMSRGIKLWDSDIYRLENIDTIRNNGLNIELGVVRYSTTRGLIVLLTKGRIESNNYPLAAGCASLIQTNDGYWIFARRSSYITSPGKIGIVGGSLIKSEQVITCGADIERALFDEIKEEIGISSEYIQSNYVIGMVMSYHDFFVVVFETKLDLSKDQVLAQFDKHLDLEMDELVFAKDISKIDSLREKNVDLDMYVEFFSDLFMPTTGV